MAQLVEQRIRNAQVPGSSPGIGSENKVVTDEVTAFFVCFCRTFKSKVKPGVKPELDMGTTVNVLCYRSKKLSNGEHPLMIRVCKDGKKKYIGLGISILPKYWDFSKNKPKNNCPQKEIVNQLINSKTEGYEEQIIVFKTVNKDFTASTLVNKLNFQPNVVTVFQIFEQ